MTKMIDHREESAAVDKPDDKPAVGHTGANVLHTLRVCRDFSCMVGCAAFLWGIIGGATMARAFSPADCGYVIGTFLQLALGFLLLMALTKGIIRIQGKTSAPLGHCAFKGRASAGAFSLAMVVAFHAVTLI